MPAHGYQSAVVNPEYGLLALREVSLDLSVADSRRASASLTACADRFESGAWRSDHSHIGRHDRAWSRDHPDLDVIVLHSDPANLDR